MSSKKKIIALVVHQIHVLGKGLVTLVGANDSQNKGIN